MRRLALATMLICLHTLALGAEPAGADPEDTPAARRQAAQRYADANDLQKMLTDITDAMAQDLPPEKRAEVTALMKYVRIDALKEAMLIAMVQHFTTRELNALADFYGSVEGKAAIAKLGPYMNAVMPMVQAEIQHAIEARKAEKAQTPGT